MKRLTLIAACLPLLALTGLTQRSETQERRPPTGVITAPGGQVVVAPRDTPESPAAMPCAEAAPAVRVALVIRGVANLRDRANIAGRVVGEVKRGAALVIEGEDGPGSPWYEVTDVATGRRGWVHGNVIRVAYRK